MVTIGRCGHKKVRNTQHCGVMHCYNSIQKCRNHRVTKDDKGQEASK